MAKKTKVYTMEVTVSVTLPEDYTYGESECEDICYSAVTQRFGALGHNSPAVKGRDARWLDVYTECEKAQLIEEIDR